MRKVLMFFLASVLLSSAAAAQYDIGYIAFYADVSRTTNCISSADIPDPPANVVNGYIYCLPGPLGQRCAEFQVNFPANTELITIINGPDINLTMGDIDTGIAVSVSRCLRNWTMLMQLVFYVNDSNLSALSFAPSSVSGLLVFCNCETGYPPEPIRVLNELILNVDPDDPACVFGTKELSWGAIKNIYKD